MSKRYRITPISKNSYRTEYLTEYPDLINTWVHTDYCTFSSLEKAEEHIKRHKNLSLMWEQQIEEEKQFRKENPPIYL